jgi:hypothetical protein
MTIKTKSLNHPTVLKIVKLTDDFESELSSLIDSAAHLSARDKNEIASELESTVQNINFMLKFVSSVSSKKD